MDEHSEKEASTPQNTCEFRAEDPFGILSNQPTILLAKSQGHSQYVVQFRDVNPDVGASLCQILRVTGLQRLSACANWSFDERRSRSSVLQRGLHGGIFHVFIG